MPTEALAYPLAGASMVSALIITILNGLVYAATQSMPSHAPATDLAPVALSAISCVALIVLSLLLHKEVRTGCQRWAGWKMGAVSFTGAYLLIAAGSVAGTMATSRTAFASRPRATLFIARSVFWAVSAFTQGLYCGFLLTTLTQKAPGSEWPRSYSHELKAVPDSPSTISPPARAVCDPYRSGTGLDRFGPNTSSLRKYPRRSNRFSGGTLCCQSTKETKHASLDSSSSTWSSPESSSLNDGEPESPSELHGTRPLLRGSTSVRSMPSLRQTQETQLSLDSLVRQPSPSASMTRVDSLTDGTSRENHIHPLFRSNSPSPSPTPSPGTVVKASPSAGQTITVKTLSHIRSAHSLRDQAMRSPSPLPGAEFDDGLVHRSVTQDKKKHDLRESPDEK